MCNENIDVVNYTSNIKLFIQRALSPAKISSIVIDEENKKLVIDFCFDGADDLRERFFKEKGPGTIKKVADNKYVYEAELYDPIGLIPWIRSFGSHAVVRSSDEHTVREFNPS